MKESEGTALGTWGPQVKKIPALGCLVGGGGLVALVTYTAIRKREGDLYHLHPPFTLEEESDALFSPSLFKSISLPHPPSLSVVKPDHRHTPARSWLPWRRKPGIGMGLRRGGGRGRLLRVTNGRIPRVLFFVFPPLASVKVQ